MRLIAIPIILIIAISLITKNIPPVNADWCYSTKITIDHTKIQSDLTNFPVLVFLNETRIGIWDNILIGNDPAGLVKDNVIFVGSDGRTLLDAEVEGIGVEKAWVWVKIPLISSTIDTIFYLHYGNTVESSWSIYGEVWDSEAIIVTHQENIIGVPQVRDRSVYLNHGIKRSALEPTQVSGYIDYDQWYNGAYDLIIHPAVASHETIDTNDQFTVGVWFKGTGSWSAGHEMFLANENLNTYMSINNGHLYSSVFVDSTQYVTDTNSYPKLNTWYQAYFTYDGNNIYTYYNGVQASEHYHATGDIAYQGKFMTGSWMFNYVYSGELDEFRVYNKAKSPAWIMVDYYSTTDQLLSYSEHDIYSPVNAPNGMYLILALILIPLGAIVFKKRR